MREAEGGARQLRLGFPSREGAGVEEFLVGEANGRAVEMIGRWPEWQQPFLLLLGSSGAGKSHLLRIWRERAGGQAVSALDPSWSGVAQAWLEAPEPPPLAIDDAHRVSGDGAAERLLFHVYNRARSGCALLLTGRAPPMRWGIELPDLRSRLQAMPIVTIGPPSDDLIAGILLKLLTDRGLRVTPQVISYAVPRLERSYDAIADFAARLDDESLSNAASPGVRLAGRIMGWTMADTEPGESAGIDESARESNQWN